MEKLQRLGGKVVACSDSGGYIYDERGIDLDRVKQIMTGIHQLCFETADEYGTLGNDVDGANIAGFIKVARAMVALGVI